MDPLGNRPRRPAMTTYPYIHADAYEQSNDYRTTTGTGRATESADAASEFPGPTAAGFQDQFEPENHLRF